MNLVTASFSSNNKILDWSKLKAFAHNKLNVAQVVRYSSKNLENILEKE